MSILSPEAQAMLDDFAACKGWEQRARLLLKYGQQLPEIPINQRCDTQLISGCESPVWCQLSWPEGQLNLVLDTDARLLKGLLAVLRTRLQGLSHVELQQTDLPSWFEQLDLANRISASRANGLHAVYQHICAQALTPPSKFR